MSDLDIWILKGISCPELISNGLNFRQFRDIHFWGKLPTLFFFFFFLFMVVLGLHLCMRAFSSCGKREPLLIVVHGPLTIAASLVVEHRLQTRRLSNCGSRAHLLHGMWDPPRPGIEPVSPALAGRLSTTAPPGKPPLFFLFYLYLHINNAAPNRSVYVSVSIY